MYIESYFIFILFQYIHICAENINKKIPNGNFRSSLKISAQFVLNTWGQCYSPTPYALPLFSIKSLRCIPRRPFHCLVAHHPPPTTPSLTSQPFNSSLCISKTFKNCIFLVRQILRVGSQSVLWSGRKVFSGEPVQIHVF